MCDGVGAAVQRLGERLRRAVDLEHWAAYQHSFGRLVDLLRSISVGLDGRPPASITLLSGDVHTTYVADVDLGGIGRRFRAPDRLLALRNPLKVRERRIVKTTGSRAAAKVFSRLARLAGVEPMDVTWKTAANRTFDNSIGQLELDGRGASITLFRTAPPRSELADPVLGRDESYEERLRFARGR